MFGGVCKATISCCDTANHATIKATLTCSLETMSQQFLALATGLCYRAHIRYATQVTNFFFFFKFFK